MDAIAVIGVGCLLPGSKTPQAFYRSLLDQRCFISQPELPPINATDFPGLVLPKLYEDLDESFLQTLYITQQALLESRYLLQPNVLKRTGLILGTRETCHPKLFELFGPAYFSELETSIQQLLNDARFKFDSALQNGQGQNSANSPLNAFHFSFPALLAAQTLGLGGPTFALDAACASALYSIKVAAGYLASGDADMMVAGGFMSGLTSEVLRHYFASLGVAAEQGNSCPLDRNSGGMAANDGGGVVVLKRLVDAVKDGDTIQLVINGIGWRNQCGKGKLILAPSKEGQVSTYQDTFEALAESGITPADIDFIECHATGTPVGDTIELNTLDTFFERHASQPFFGSVKGNIGHLLSGSGIAALIKVIYSIREGIIPATVNVSTPLSSRRKRFGAANLVTEKLMWPTGANTNRVRRAAISCFGFGGSHAHMVVSEYRASEFPLNAGVPASSGSKQSPLAVMGMGVQLGPVTGVEGLISALEKGLPEGNSNNARFRGMEQNASIQEHFVPADTFNAGLHCEHFEFDFLKSGVNTESKGEALNKELLLLNVVDQALLQAGILRGEGRRVGVVVAARQNLCQVQMHLEYYLPRLLDDALANSGIMLTDADKHALIKLARDAVMNQSNSGFDFVATGIGPVVASRIAAAWGFTGPAMKLCCLENSLIRSLEVAEKMLRFDGLEAVVVAVADNDPALESRILLKKYGAQLGLNIANRLIDDSAVALVLTLQQQAEVMAQPVLAVLDQITSSVSPTESFVAAVDTAHVEYFGSRFQGTPQAATSICQQFGFSLATSAALAVVKAVVMTRGELNSVPQPVHIYGAGFDGQTASLRVSPASDSAGPAITDRPTEKSKERGLVKTITNDLVSIRSVLLSPEARARFSHFATSCDAKRSSTSASLPASNSSYFAQVFRQNCQIQNVYYNNQQMLSALLADRLAANVSVMPPASCDPDTDLRN